MAVQWGLGLTQNNIGQNALAAFEQGRQMRRQRETENALRSYATNPTDPAAMQQVIQADPRLGIQLQDSQRTRQREAAREAAPILLPIYEQLRQLPYEQRGAMLQQIAPRLATIIPPEIIANYDPTDERLQGDMTIARELARGDGYTLSEGDVRYDDRGNVVARGPAPRPNYIPLAPGGRLVLEPGTGGVPSGSNAPQTAVNPTTGERIQFNPQTNAWEPIQGGTASSGQAPFDPSAMLPITLQSESGNRDYENGRPVTSRAGARYAMQTMPATARDPGFGVTPARSDSPAEFNRVGREYLSAMMRRYSNDPAKAWAAYNGGPGRVDDAMRRGGANWLSLMPRETQDYVRRNVRQLRGP